MKTLNTVITRIHKMFTIHVNLPPVPVVTLENMIHEVNERDTVVSLCVELKSYLKHDLELHLHVLGDTATGEGLILP